MADQSRAERMLDDFRLLIIERPRPLLAVIVLLVVAYFAGGIIYAWPYLD